MTACIQSVTTLGSELWWRKGDHFRGTIGQAHELQLLVNQEARATTSCFRTTNLGALSMESGLRATTAQLENRQRRFGLRLLSLPLGDQAREIVGRQQRLGGGSPMPLHIQDRRRPQSCWRNPTPSMQS